MTARFQTWMTLAGLPLLLLALAGGFWFELWGRPPQPRLVPPTDPQFTNTATVRLSAAELIRTGGDSSGFVCYACHDEKKAVVVKLDVNQHVVLSDAHKDILMRHGRNQRNDHCFNCHDAKNLVMLRAHEGQSFKLTESNQLCGSCHGPTLRDWEAGIHGRTSGFWDRKLGAATRQDCTSCHDPHNPAFPPQKPGPGPNLLHPKPAASPRGANSR